LQNVPADFVTKDGEVVHALISAATGRLRDADDFAMLFSICVDVSPQTRLEKSLAATFAIAPVPMLVRRCDNGRIIDANEAFLAVAGYAAADVLGHSFDEICSFETVKRWKAFETLTQATGRGDATEVTLKTGSGDKLDCILTATKIWMLGNDCMLLVLQDVSDRRRTEVELMSALEAVMNDSSWFSRSVVERLAAMRTPPKSGRRAAALGDLTPRERDVLSLISLGLPDIEIAERLGLTKSTIRNHLSTLYGKIDVKNRGSAIIWARDRCLNVTQLPLRPKKLQSVFGPGRPANRKPTVFGRDEQAKSDVKVATGL
jgi:PAS domain S-box-containing protein